MIFFSKLWGFGVLGLLTRVVGTHFYQKGVVSIAEGKWILKKSEKQS